MPRYDVNDITEVSVGFADLAKGDYEVQVGTPKAFERVSASSGKNSYGIRFPLQVVSEGEFKGGRQVFTAYWHVDAAKGFGVAFIMACLGFNPGNPADERKFKEQFKAGDWGFDTDSGAVGDMWNAAAGKRVIASVVRKMNKETGEDGIQFSGFIPVKG